MSSSIFEIIRYIVWRATEAKGGLSTLALVKYLYLADLFYAEETSGKTVTGLPWIFYHYGPYCTESYKVIEDAVSRGLILAKSYQSKYEEGEEYKWYSSLDRDEPTLDVPIHVWASLSKAIAEFEDIRDLMNFVYFETAPMQYAKEKQPLDFSTAKKIKPEAAVIMNRLSAKKIKKAQELLSKMHKAREKYGLVNYAGPKPVYDDVYYQFSKTLDDECEVPNVSGKLIFFD